MCNESWHIKINLVHDFEDEGEEVGCVVRKFMAIIWWTINLKGIHWENKILRNFSRFEEAWEQSTIAILLGS